MPLSSKTYQSPPPEGVHFLYFVPENSVASGDPYSPYFFVEARIDFNDVRTGFRKSAALGKALEIYPSNTEFLWAPDMMRDVDLLKTRSSAPEGVHLGRLPAFVDRNLISRMETQFVEYCLRSFTAQAYRNFALSIYSASGESRAEFAARCLELLDGPIREELDLLAGVFKRRLEQAKEKYLSANEPGELELAKMESRKRSIFSRYSDRIMAHFLRGDRGPDPAADASGSPRQISELEEKMICLEQEAGQAAAKVRRSYEEKAQTLDEYLLHPNPKDIHIVRSGILWMPQWVA